MSRTAAQELVARRRTLGSSAARPAPPSSRAAISPVLCSGGGRGIWGEADWFPCRRDECVTNLRRKKRTGTGPPAEWGTNSGYGGAPVGVEPGGSRGYRTGFLLVIYSGSYTLFFFFVPNVSYFF